MIDLNSDRAGVNGAGLSGVLAVALKFGSGSWPQKSKGIEIALEISPLAVGCEHTFALRIGSVGRSTVKHRAGGLGFRGHRNAGSRIKDAGKSKKARQKGERP